MYIDDYGAENLKAAIVEQAIADYRQVLRGRPIRDYGGGGTNLSKEEKAERRRRSCELSRRELETFFRSDWFRCLSDANGQKIIDALKDERKKEISAMLRS